jgi:hypothetical protein
MSFVRAESGSSYTPGQHQSAKIRNSTSSHSGRKDLFEDEDSNLDQETSRDAYKKTEATGTIRRRQSAGEDWFDDDDDDGDLSATAPADDDEKDGKIDRTEAGGDDDDPLSSFMKANAQQLDAQSKSNSFKEKASFLDEEEEDAVDDYMKRSAARSEVGSSIDEGTPPFFHRPPDPPSFTSTTFLSKWSTTRMGSPCRRKRRSSKPWRRSTMAP